MYKWKYFTLDELTKSKTAEQNGIDNTPSEEEKDNLTALVLKILDPLREAYGHPITVNSAYRSKELNKLVGGASSSQHLQGQAADLTTGTKEGNKAIFYLLKSMNNYDQLINENDYSWVHVSYKRIGYNRKQVLNIS